MNPVGDDLLAEQRAYYAARAPVYENDLYDWPGVEAAVEDVTSRVPRDGPVLELACGTGVWTERLLRRSADVTAVDAAPEMIALARRRAGAAQFLVADVFDWSPPRRYDSVFFGFWLSHVPDDRFEAFWATIGAALADGGRVVFVDEHVSGRDKETWLGPQTAERTLPDGSAHRIVKAYLDPEPLSRRLADLGWTARIDELADGAWVVGDATRG